MKKTKFLPIIFLAIVLIALLSWYLSHHIVAVLSPAGEVARRERDLIFICLGLAVFVVVPVFVMAASIAWRYREDNHKIKERKYSPDWDHSKLYESLWWGIPICIIGILSVITWESSHALDPYKPLSSTVPAMQVDVVALDWKWLFIYPQQHIASVNQLEIPVNVPIDFYITSDTVMNSFWVPQLGGQIYAMPGMATQLHLIANKTGGFYGSSANISGDGFASMHFMTYSVSQANFNKWANNAAKSPKQLTGAAYSQLAKPSQNNPVAYYSYVPSDMYDTIVTKYMTPSSTSGSSTNTSYGTSNTSGLYVQ